MSSAAFPHRLQGALLRQDKGENALLSPRVAVIAHVKFLHVP